MHMHKMFSPLFNTPPIIRVLDIRMKQILQNADVIRISQAIFNKIHGFIRGIQHRRFISVDRFNHDHNPFFIGILNNRFRSFRQFPQILHTAPSSQAMHPIEAVCYHQSHLKKQQDYGHQAVGVMLSCNELSLNYAIVLYDKSHSKIEIVQDIIQELPKPLHTAYFLCDSWYASNKLMDAFAQKGFQTIGALHINRIIYPNQVKQQAKQFAPDSCRNDPNANLVTVGKRSYYVFARITQLMDDAILDFRLGKYSPNRRRESRQIIRAGDENVLHASRGRCCHSLAMGRILSVIRLMVVSDSSMP